MGHYISLNGEKIRYRWKSKEIGFKTRSGKYITFKATIRMVGNKTLREIIRKFKV